MTEKKIIPFSPSSEHQCGDECQGRLHDLLMDIFRGENCSDNGRLHESGVYFSIAGREFIDFATSHGISHRALQAQLRYALLGSEDGKHFPTLVFPRHLEFPSSLRGVTDYGWRRMFETALEQLKRNQERRGNSWLKQFFS